MVVLPVLFLLNCVTVWKKIFLQSFWMTAYGLGVSTAGKISRNLETNFKESMLQSLSKLKLSLFVKV